MTDISLKLCPFCGGEAQLIDMRCLHWVCCIECGARVQSTKFAEEGDAEAIAKWNRRVEIKEGGRQWQLSGEARGWCWR